MKFQKRKTRGGFGRKKYNQILNGCKVKYNKKYCKKCKKENDNKFNCVCQKCQEEIGL